MEGKKSIFFKWEAKCIEKKNCTSCLLSLRAVSIVGSPHGVLSESWRSRERSHGRREKWPHCSVLEIGRSYGCEEFWDLKKYQPLAASHLNFENGNYNNNQIFISWPQELQNSSSEVKWGKVRLLFFPPTLSKLLEDNQLRTLSKQKTTTIVL